MSGSHPHQLAPQQPTQQHQAVEFDHAITYVTTIKKRFEKDPKTYQQFLEILHTYQKEQRGIREVLEQVTSLFADHPDLLKEFTHFLPEAVQEQAKERLHRAAADAEARQAAQAAVLFAQSRQQQTDREKAKLKACVIGIGGNRADTSTPPAYPSPGYGQIFLQGKEGRKVETLMRKISTQKAVTGANDATVSTSTTASIGNSSGSNILLSSGLPQQRSLPFPSLPTPLPPSSSSQKQQKQQQQQQQQQQQISDSVNSSTIIDMTKQQV